MTVNELLAAIEAAGVDPETEVFGPGGALRTVHLEDGVLVLEEADPEIIERIGHGDDTVVLWPSAEPAAA